MKKIKAYFDDFDASVISTRRVRFLEILAAMLFGIIIGIMIAPPRKMNMGCNNGNNNIAEGNGCGCGNDRECGSDDDDKKEDEE